MNYIKHLSGFFDKVSKDDRLNPTHVSLYVSLFQFWNACRFHNPISISRNEAMKVSKISSKATYHKCIRELNDFGYLSYQPSYNPFKGSLVYLFNFQAGVEKKLSQPKIGPSSEQVLNDYHTKIETSTEQALVPYINNINNTKQQTEVKSLSKKNQDGKNNNSNSAISTLEILQQPSRDPDGHKNQKSTKKEKKVPPGAAAEVSPPSPQERGQGGEARCPRPLLQHVQNYFSEKNWPAIEAEKYYNHYQSNGWLVGGKTPMVNWQASAEKWMLNSKTFSQSNLPSPLKMGQGMRLHTTNEKNYNEPL